MSNEINENDYFDMLDDIEIEGAVKVAVDDVIDCIDSHMMALEPVERIAVGMRLAMLMSANTLANALRDERHLLNPALESLSEDIAKYMETMFEAFDNGALTTH